VARKNSANGRPKPKRTKVAPVVPITAFRCFCAADRRFCRKAAAMVMGIQSSMSPPKSGAD
jgi:hypothetical protein